VNEEQTEKLPEIIKAAKELAEETYREWRGYYRSAELRMKTDERSLFVNYYSRIAHIARLEATLMGKEKNKLQQRIGRQRAANRKLQWRIKELEQRVKKQQEEIRGLREQEPSAVAQLVREYNTRQLRRERPHNEGWDTKS
jgi:hypothetical protein